MKVLNVILSILILLLAAVSAVSSYLLFVKRGQMVKGWEKMATAISQTATEMDRGSGTKVGTELTAATLGHKQYESLDGRLAKLKQQATQLVAERDALAAAVRRAGEIIGMSNLPAETAFREIVSYNTSKDEVLNGLVDFKNRRDRMVRDLCTSAAKIGVQLKPEDFQGAGAEAALRKFDAKVDAIRVQFSAYQSNVRAIASIAGAPVPNLDENAYAASLNNVAAAVRDLKSKLDNALALVEKVKAQLSSTQNVVKQRDSQIGTLKTTIDSKDSEIAQLRKALGLDPAVEFKPWQPGSVECRRAVRGKVIEVNEKFGFIAIDLGKNTVVQQTVGNKKLDVNPEIATGMEMVVARNMDTKEVEFIGKIKLTTVDGDCSIGETIELAPDYKVQVGDQVYFQDPAAPEKKDAAPAKPAAEKK